MQDAPRVDPKRQDKVQASQASGDTDCVKQRWKLYVRYISRPHTRCGIVFYCITLCLLHDSSHAGHIPLLHWEPKALASLKKGQQGPPRPEPPERPELPERSHSEPPFPKTPFLLDASPLRSTVSFWRNCLLHGSGITRSLGNLM